MNSTGNIECGLTGNTPTKNEEKPKNDITILSREKRRAYDTLYRLQNKNRIITV